MKATSPYCNHEDHIMGFTFPLRHATQLVRNIFQLVLNAFFFIGELLEFDFNALTETLHDTSLLVISIVIETLNIALSVISLATRLLASIFNLGYTTLEEEEKISYTVNSTAFSLV